jgi:transcription antitermination factor NusG
MTERWYVCECDWKSEWKACERLIARSFRAVVPSYRSDRGIRPLFLTYLFVQFDIRNRWRSIVRVSGVKRLLGPDEKPTPLPEGVADQFLECRELDEIAPPVLVAVGTAVRIHTGPLTGLTGVVSRSNRQRVSLLMQMLTRESTIDVSPSWIEPIAAA